MRATRIGGPTVLVELDGWRILIDPTFDPPGRRFPFALGTSSVKTRGPAIEASTLGVIDLILVSHDHHADTWTTPVGSCFLPRPSCSLQPAAPAGSPRRTLGA